MRDPARVQRLELDLLEAQRRIADLEVELFAVRQQLERAIDRNVVLLTEQPSPPRPLRGV